MTGYVQYIKLKYLDLAHKYLKSLSEVQTTKISGNLARKTIQRLDLQKYLAHLITTAILVEIGCLNTFKDMAIKLQEQIKYSSA